MDSHTINLAPEAKCNSNPHICGLTPVLRPTTPNADAWFRDHGDELVTFLEHVQDEDYLADHLVDNRSDGVSLAQAIVSDYLEVSFLDVKRERQELANAAYAAMHYASIHGIPWFLAEFAKEEE